VCTEPVDPAPPSASSFKLSLILLFTTVSFFNVSSISFDKVIKSKSDDEPELFAFDAVDEVAVAGGENEFKRFDDE
jgi:hypothetical protein